MAVICCVSWWRVSLCWSISSFISSWTRRTRPSSWCCMSRSWTLLDRAISHFASTLEEKGRAKKGCTYWKPSRSSWFFYLVLLSTELRRISISFCNTFSFSLSSAPTCEKERQNLPEHYLGQDSSVPDGKLGYLSATCCVQSSQSRRPGQIPSV